MEFRSGFLLLVIVGMERFAFKGIASNMVTYLTDVLEMSNSRAAKTVNSWFGFNSLLPLFSGPLADAYGNRFLNILAASSIYFLALVGLTWNSATSTMSTHLLYGSLGLVSVGLGVLSPSLHAFCADQLDHELEKRFEHLPPSDDVNESKARLKSRFFERMYVCVCTGCLLGVTVMSYIQDTFGWVLGFGIPAIAMFLWILLFLSGCAGSPLAKILAFFKGRVMRKRNDEGLVAMEQPLFTGDTADPEDIVEVQSASTTATESSETFPLFSTMDYVKLVLRLLPIWTMLLMFAVIFQQPTTFFTKQGMTMKRDIGSFKIPPATLQSAITISIILIMPVYEKLLIPITKRIKNNGEGITVMERMGVGMFLSIVAIVIAALVERKRLDISHKMKTLPDFDVQTIPMSIFWLLPQYMLLGFADMFTVVGMQQFFYNEVPIRMRTTGCALNTSIFGVGSFVSAGLISIVETYSSSAGEGENWFADDMSKARLDKYYWLLAVTSTVSFVVYMVLCKYFTSRVSLA